MEKDDDSLEEQTNGEEGLFDLSLDDLSPDDIDQETSKEDPDKEIIELIELVEKGEKHFGEDDAEITQSYEDDRPTKELVDPAHMANALSDSMRTSDEEASLSETDMELANLSLESDLLKGDKTDIEAGSEDFTENDIEPEESLDDLIEEADMAESSEDMNMTIHSPISSTEVHEVDEKAIGKEPEKEIEAELSEQADDKVTPLQDAQPAAEEMITISDEKIEAILTKLVRDVVERVVRETVAEVAEKVIREAIDALKESIEKASE